MQTHYQTTDLQNIFNHLAMAFLYSPEDGEIYKNYILPFQSDTLSWPLPLDKESQDLLTKYHAKITWDQPALVVSWQNIFIGPAPLKAPPYSSVYLDKEQVIFGSSHHDFTNFLSALGLTFTLEQGIPEDHIGVMLLALAFLIGEDVDSAKILLSDHLLTWSIDYFVQLEREYETDYFYRFLARVALSSLVTLKKEWQLTVKDVVVYPYIPLSS